MQVPSNVLMSTKKVRPLVYMSVWMILWAVASACNALLKNYTSAVIVRFFLGVAEALFYPGALYMLSLFYTRKDIATHISILYSSNIVATAVSGLIAAATFNTLENTHVIAGWRWLFIIEGDVTFGVGLIGIFILPDHWLSLQVSTVLPFAQGYLLR